MMLRTRRLQRVPSGDYSVTQIINDSTHISSLSLSLFLSLSLSSRCESSSSGQTTGSGKQRLSYSPRPSLPTGLLVSGTQKSPRTINQVCLSRLFFPLQFWMDNISSDFTKMGILKRYWYNLEDSFSVIRLVNSTNFLLIYKSGWIGRKRIQTHGNLRQRWFGGKVRELEDWCSQNASWRQRLL